MRTAGARRDRTALDTTLAEIVTVSEQLRDDWWIIGSAAMALVGIGVEVPDIDLLVSDSDARVLLASWATPEAPAVWTDRFRSLFGIHSRTPLPIEVMGGLEVIRSGKWVPIRPMSRVRIELAAGAVFVPEASEQVAILRSFGRPKDLTRAALFELRTEF